MLNLAKGSSLNLAKETPTVRRFRVGLDWKENSTDTGKAFDLDVTMFALRNGKAKEEDVLFYNADNRITSLTSTQVVKLGTLPKLTQSQSLPVLPNLAAIHTGDNITGAGGAGDKEAIIVDLDLMDAAGYDSATFINTIYDAVSRKQTFGQVSGAKATLYEHDTNKVLATFDLEDDFSVETALEVVNFTKKDGEWRFKAIGTGYKSGLDAFVSKYVG